MRRLQLFRCAFVLILAGCSINRAGLANDIQALLDRCNVKPKTTNVIMANRSRTGIIGKRMGNYRIDPTRLGLPLLNSAAARPAALAPI